MKEFIEKLIGRLKEARDWYSSAQLVYCHNPVYVESFINREAGMNLAIEIVNQLAEEYKGGWIPCSKSFPKANMQVIVTAEKGGYRYTTDAYFYNGKFYNKHYYKIPVGELNDSSVGDNVLAWQSLPQPYEYKEVNK